MDEFGIELLEENLFCMKFIPCKTEIKRSRELEYINEKQVVNFEITPVNIRLITDKNVKTVILKIMILKNQ